jgi:hypothetical protein
VMVAGRDRCARSALTCIRVDRKRPVRGFSIVLAVA